MIPPLLLLAKEYSLTEDKFKVFYDFMSDLLKLGTITAVDPTEYFDYLIKSGIKMLESNQHEDQMDFFDM
jgi:hypothetical protein